MTEWFAPPRDSASERWRRVVAAALRAAYAWSVRNRYPSAMHEVARMTGVVMEAHGPGRGPTAPMELVECLHRPLGELLAFAEGADELIAGVILLDADGGLTSDAYDLAAEYALPLSATFDGADWMPTWTRMHADRIRHETFAAMIDTRRQQDYVVSRRFLVEHPAGSREELGELVSTIGAGVAWKGYVDIPAGQVHRPGAGTGWWWPCPDCRWPMAVSGRTVRCRYRPHSAVYQLTDGRTPQSRPTLGRVDEGPRVAKPEARSAQDAACLDTGVWRFVVVPGCSELRIYRALDKPGVEVVLWPELDAYDLYVRVGTTEFRVDVKEYRSVHRLIADLRARTPQACVLLPKTHEHQLNAVSSALPGLSFTTETRFLAAVRRELARS